ncbi:MAG: hemopexin repeat-containing protein [Syntrophales bacterium]|nr:hemopexin repeat-containing protein [Syntrophales bacterium]
MKKLLFVMAVFAILLFIPFEEASVWGERYEPERMVDAAVNWGNGKVYFFKGGKYIRYSARPDMDDELFGPRPDPGYPKEVNHETWPGLPWKEFDAVLNWGSGVACFFKGGQFVRYNMIADRAEPDYPLPINDKTWPGLIWEDGIDAAVNWGNGKVFFFKRGEYIRYDIKTNRADPGYPKPINYLTWPGLVWTDGIDDVVIWGNGKVYFFRGDEYIRYDIKEDRVDPGYPKKIDSQTWPGLQWK